MKGLSKKIHTGDLHFARVIYVEVQRKDSLKKKNQNKEFSWGLSCHSTFLQQEHITSSAFVSGKPQDSGQATGYLIPFWAGVWLSKFGEVKEKGAHSQRWWPHLGRCVHVLSNKRMHGRNWWVDLQPENLSTYLSCQLTHTPLCLHRIRNCEFSKGLRLM